MKILITGCCGFIGSHVSEYFLKNNYQVFGIDNMNDYYDVTKKNFNLNILNTYKNFKFKKDDIILFGRESAGVPDLLHKSIKHKLKIPINKKTRSLNVAMSVAIVSSEALRQNDLLK